MLALIFELIISYNRKVFAKLCEVGCISAQDAHLVRILISPIVFSAIRLAWDDDFDLAGNLR